MLFHLCQVEYKSWFDYIQEWEEVFTNRPEYPINIVYYEDLKEVGTGTKLQVIEEFIKFRRVTVMLIIKLNLFPVPMRNR